MPHAVEARWENFEHYHNKGTWKESDRYRIRWDDILKFMMNPRNPGRNYLWAKIILGVIASIDLILGIYHLTHHGLTSGTIELVFSILLLSLGVGLFQGRLRKNSDGKPNLARRAGLGIIALIAGVVFILSIYHFFSNGLRSGFLELIMTVLLSLLAYLIHKS
jgi:hypothetical protein